jgi:hypothetical protein
MAHQYSLISRPGAQSDSVKFIENRAQQYHPMFQHRNVQYDPTAGRFGPSRQNSVPTGDSGDPEPPVYSLEPSDNNDLPPRPAWADTKAMTFWSGIFPGAMAGFRNTPAPSGRPKAYDLRLPEKNDWDAVYSTLRLARAEYQRVGGPVGWLRKVRRKAADNIGPLAEATKIATAVAPSNPYSTPVLGAVEVLLDVRRTHATVCTVGLTTRL